MTYERRLNFDATLIEKRLRRIIDERLVPKSILTKAIRYALLGAGKRLRPFLLMETAAMFSVPRARALNAAAALECVHCYSLVHDDLPAMDNDDMRRGKPSVHKKFGEATAILAGDALLTLAFEILAMPQTHPDATVRAMLSLELARAAGGRGMVDGQALDLGRKLSKTALLQMHALKTGALICFAVEAGAILGGARPGERRLLRQYAEHFGAIYQLADDVADEAKDRKRGSANAVILLGAAKVEYVLAEHHGGALKALEPFGKRATILRELVVYFTEVSAPSKERENTRATPQANRKKRREPISSRRAR